MKLSDVVAVLEQIAPTQYAEPWDNVGLLVGDSAQGVDAVLVAIDATNAVIDEAARERCGLVVAYHPPIFKGLQRFVAGHPAFEAARRGIAVWSPHTALDVAVGGTNDVLADAIGMTERRPLRASATKDAQYKLVTFVPESALDAVSRAVFEAGAGRIGQYSSCSFRSPGTGTFLGEEGTNPAVGESGKLEVAPEVKLETLVPIARVAAVIAAMRAAHPYEEPAFDLVRLAVPPDGPGIGRVGAVSGDRRAIVEALKRAVGVDVALVAGPLDGPARRAAVCAGAGDELLGDAIAERADLYVTGELRHHDALRASARGVTVVALRHSVSERCTLPRLVERLSRELGGVRVTQSREDRDPFSVV
ncbi:MAG: Nif3-like dinuclear metal center hexameric protein [Deltaproteobacteria bacterium]|nr:Nif3-like dinuclear metal center hexameric protein [Deltaproteobacteria bacterium]